jgi:hypothetical protein
LLLGMPVLRGVCAARRHGLRCAERRPLDEQHARPDRRQARSAVLSRTQDALLASAHASATCCVGTDMCGRRRRCGRSCALQGVAAPDDVRRRLGGHADSTRWPTPTLAISSLTHARRPPRARPRVWPNPMSCMRMGITPAVDEFRVHVARPRAQALLVWSHLPVRRLLSSLRTRALGAGGLIVPKDSLVRKNMHKGLYINFKLK